MWEETLKQADIILLHFVLLCVTDNAIFLDTLKGCENSVSSRSIDVTFQKKDCLLSHFKSLCHILVILTNFSPLTSNMTKTGWRLRWWLPFFFFLVITYFKLALVHCPLDLWRWPTRNKLQCNVSITITHALRKQKRTVILFTVIFILLKQFGLNLQHLQAIPIHILEIPKAIIHQPRLPRCP